MNNNNNNNININKKSINVRYMHVDNLYSMAHKKSDLNAENSVTVEPRV